VIKRPTRFPLFRPAFARRLDPHDAVVFLPFPTSTSLLLFVKNEAGLVPVVFLGKDPGPFFPA